MTVSVPRPRGVSRTRDTIFVEDARVLGVTTFPGTQFVLRLLAPETAARAVPGTFVHLQCDPAIPMRRPLSIMRVDTEEGWIEVLFKIVGSGLRSLGQRQPGDLVSLLGPIGNGFRPVPERPRTLLIGGGVGIPPMVFLAERLHQDAHPWQPLVLMGSEIPFPFEVSQSTIRTDWTDPSIDGAMPLLDGWHIPCRLASMAAIERTFRGYVTDLARTWLRTQSDAEREQTEIFACGPTPMLEAVAAVAREFALPCQVALEEFMACAVGGCAGCTVLVTTDDGPAMKRVCVDGPVFDAATVFPASPAGS
ncbi:MAG TPA: dihydroorotate dehydrogenase electron transfer subunit [Woeseiaceae bacterium]